MKLGRASKVDLELVVARSQVGKKPRIEDGPNGSHSRVDSRLEF
jgi:hypothetical protein